MLRVDMRLDTVRPDAPPPTPLRPSPGTSLHRQVFLVLRDEIARGVYAAGGVLPKEESLGERFGVSRITVRRALADLAQLGLVDRRHGRGTFVGAGASSVAVQDMHGLLRSLRRTADETTVAVIEFGRAVPPADVIAQLGLRAEEVALHALRLRRIGDVPVMLTEAWVPAAFGKGITSRTLERTPLYELLLANVGRFGRMVQAIAAQVADPRRAGWLQTEVGAPLLSVRRVMFDSRDRPVQHLTTSLAGERSQLLMDASGGAIDSLVAGRFVHAVTPAAPVSRGATPRRVPARRRRPAP
jgi:GntR family transcriptional regulator